MSDRWLLIFPAIGVFFIAAALLLQMHRWNEEESMLRTVGSVVSVSGKGCTLVEYFPRQDQRVTFSGEVCSRPGYDIGDSVEVSYDPLEPQHAHIDSFTQNWFLSLMLGSFGLIFLLGSMVFTLPEVLARARIAGLRRTGQTVLAHFLEVRRNPLSTLNGIPAWQLIYQWQNPASGAVHLFYSEDIWFDPQPFLRGTTLSVLIDPQNPKYFSIDTSFLPQLAK
jgi:hypothetical protein